MQAAISTNNISPEADKVIPTMNTRQPMHMEFLD